MKKYSHDPQLISLLKDNNVFLQLLIFVVIPSMIESYLVNWSQQYCESKYLSQLFNWKPFFFVKLVKYKNLLTFIYRNWCSYNISIH